MTERKHPKTPCADCPYRRDAPRRHWHDEEFAKVRDAQRAERQGGMGGGRVFACHKHIKLDPKDRGWCAGWALQQRADNVPSIPLRIMLMDRETAQAFRDLDPAGLDLYDSVDEMLEANSEADDGDYHLDDEEDDDAT